MTLMPILTQIPVGTKLKVKETNELVELVKIYHYPTKYEVINADGNTNYYRTHQIELIDDNQE